MPSRVRSPTPANTETPLWAFATLWISSMIVTVLPTPAPPKRPTLPPLMYGAIRSMTLMPGLEDLDRRLQVAEGRRLAVDRPALDALDRGLVVDRLADHVPDAAERRVADRHRDRPTRVDDVRAAREAVGGVHGDRAHAVVAEVLLHLRDERRGRSRRVG